MRREALLAVIALPGLAMPAETTVAGTWRGESLCAAGAPACRNETVVYLIRDVPGHGDRMWIQADKIVEGKSVTMGSGEWLYDHARGTLALKMPRQTWLLRIDGDRIEGTLEMKDKTIFRRMTLHRTH